MNSSPGRMCVVILVVVPIMAILQAAIVYPMFPGLPNINFLLPLVIAIATVQPTVAGAIAAFCAGLLSDIAVGLVLGPQAGAAVVVWLVIALLSNRVFIESKLTLIVLALLAATVFSLARLAFTLQFVSEATQSIGSILGEASLTAIIAIAVTPTLRRLLSPRLLESERDFPTRRRSSL